jgi:O-antigen/teichoic acid export membrane protein
MLRVETSASGAAVAEPSPAVAASAGDPRPRPLSLRANFAWTLAGNVVYAACQWAILVAIARLASPDAVGRFSLGLAVTGPLFLLTGLQLRASQATDAARGFRFAGYFGVRLGGMAAALVATAAIVALSGYDRDTAAVILAVAASKAIEGVSDVYYGLSQQNERMRPIAISLMWRGALSVVAVGAVLWAGGGISLATVALAASWAAVLLAYDRRAAAPLLPPSARGGPFRPEWRGAGRIVVTCLPLGVVMMLLSLRANLPRYFIEDAMGAAELGVFAALSSLLVAGNVVVSALGQSAMPRLARHYHDGDLKAFRRLLARLLAIAGIVGAAGLAVAVVAGEPLLGLVFGPPYAAQHELLVVLMAAGAVLFAASFLGYGLTAARRFAVQLPLFGATTLVAAGACLWLVPARGLRGAAYAWGGSMLVELVATWILLELALRRRAAGASP